MGKHIHGRPITLIVASLIEYILTPIQIIYLWLLTLIILSNAFHVVQNVCIYHIIPYLSHIFCLFLSFARIVYLIYFILFLVSYSLQVSYTFMFISFHVRILCMYHILSYLKYFHITYLILSYNFIYILILFIYGTFVCFHLSFTCF